MAKYCIGINNQQLGPFEVHQLLANGLTPDTLVWCSGMNGWQMAKNVPELSVLFAAQQPQYQQPQYQQPQYDGGYQQPQYGGYQQPQYGYADPQQAASDNHLAMYGERPQIDFGESIKICFNKFADFTGRARRSEFWWFYLFNMLLSSFTCIGGFVTLIPMMAVTVRRLHDTGHSAWWYFIPTLLSIIYSCTFLPLLLWGLSRGKEGPITVGFIALIIFLLISLYYGIMLLIYCCRDSDPDENEYGPSPKYQ